MTTAVRLLIIALVLIASTWLLHARVPAGAPRTVGAQPAVNCDPATRTTACPTFIPANRKNAAALISIAAMAILTLLSFMAELPRRPLLDRSSASSFAFASPAPGDWPGLLLRIGAPLSLSLLEMFHPRPPADFFIVDLGRWLPIHYLQIWLFPLAALAMVSLADRAGSRAAARACRVAMFIFATCYIAFDTAAGVVTAELVRAAHSSPSPDAWRSAVTTIWTNPIIGGGGSTAPILAVLGTFAWLAGAIAAAVGVRRAGGGWTSVVLLVISGLGLLVFRSHAWPGGPLTFAALAAAAASIDLPRYRKPFPAPTILPHAAGVPT